MGLLDYVRRKSYQRSKTETERATNVRLCLIEMLSEGKEIDGVLVIFLKHGKICVTEGGLQDDFEAQVLIRRAEYLINRDGLITQ